MAFGVELRSVQRSGPDRDRPPEPTTIATRLARVLPVLAELAPGAEAAGLVDERAVDALRDSGLLLAPFPDALGGDALVDKPADLFAVLRAIGGADLCWGRLFEGHANAVALAVRYGHPGLVAAFADQVRGGALSAVWNAEGAVGLRAERVAGGWRLKGQKILASGAGLVARPVVTAATDDGQIMLVPHLALGQRADLGAWHPQGMRATATGTVDFTNLVVSDAQVIGIPGDYMRQPWFSGGAWRFCAVHLGAAERLVDLFRAQLRARGRGDDPYQLQRIASCVAATTTAAFWIGRAADLLSAPADDPDAVVAFVNLTRGVTERACLDVLEAVQRGIGLGAFMAGNPMERITRDLATYLRQPVPDAAMADAARAVLASHQPTAALWSQA